MQVHGSVGHHEEMTEDVLTVEQMTTGEETARTHRDLGGIQAINR